MNNIAQLRDTINAAYRAVWYFRRSQDFYAIRWAHEALARTRGLIERFAPVPQVALDNAAHVVESALQAADIVLTADYLEAGLLPPLLELQAEEIARMGAPEPERIRFEQNLLALLGEENGASVAEAIFGEASAKDMAGELMSARHVADAQWEEAVRLLAVLEESGYTAEYTATGDVTLKHNGYYLHTNNTPVIEGMNWATRSGAASHRVFGAGLFYHILGLQELYPGLQTELIETNPVILAYALFYTSLAEILSEGGIALSLLDETEDGKTLRQLFPEEDSDEDGIIKRTHAASVTTLQDKDLREYLLRFGDRNGLQEGSSPKLVSVVIPCYNAVEVIDRCLLSVVKQTIGIDQIEVICVDDASTDATLEKLQEWARRYPLSFKIVQHKENGRQGKSRNTGILHATARYLTIIDNDDWIEPDMLEEMVRIAEETGVEVVAGTHGIDLGDGNPVNVEGYQGILNEPVYVKTEEDRRILVKNGLHSNVWGKLYRREIFWRYDLFFPEGLVYEDNFFGPLLKYSVSSYYVTDKLYYHWYDNPKSTGIGRNETYHFDRLKVEELKLQELEKRGLLDGPFSEEIMADFVNKYYLNSLHIFFLKFDEPPYEQIAEACEGLKKRYPDLRTTHVYESLNETQRMLIDQAFEDAPKELWKAIFTEYNEAARKM